MNYMKFLKKFWEKIRPKTYFDLLVLNMIALILIIIKLLLK